MKTDERPESQMASAKTNPNKKDTSAVQNGDKKLETSLLKKNEFALILFGALLLTIIIFFLFFRSDDTNTDSVSRVPGPSFTDLEKRIERIELALQSKNKTGQAALEASVKKTSTDRVLTDRVTRLETAFSVKFDSLTERMGKMEDTVSLLSKKQVAAYAKPIESKSAPVVKKPMKKPMKKPSVFHSVQKGETLYSISKKYNTTVSALRELNHLSNDAKIFPGNNILVR